MFSKSIALPIACMAAMATAETVRSVVVFSRHGDRTTKWYGSQQLTSLGAEQNFAVGSDYRARYLSADSDHQIRGISEDEYVRTQIFASAPDQGILMNTATSFLQGLYPPLVDLAPELATQTLNNGNSTSPLDGYQYVMLHGINDNSPDTIWIKGDDACPAYKTASKSFEKSDVFAARVDATRDFYASFYDELSPNVYNLKPENMTYANAYNIYDLINVARIHNESSPALNVSDADLLQLRTLADSSELGLNYNASQPARSIGAETLSGAVLSKLNESITSKGKLKFSLFAGSYDTMLMLFARYGLLDVSDDFYGLPDYASTIAFELFSDNNDDAFPSDDDLKVRWLFRNGTAGNLTAFPLFGTGEESLSWARFTGEMEKLAISDVGTWCERCDGFGKTDFCAAYEDDENVESSGEGGSNGGSGNGGMSNAVAGMIGAVVALAVAGIVGAAAFLIMRKRKTGSAAAREKTGSVRSGSTDGPVAV
ncbi:histidine phosphatase superfamily [Plectosphaerella plurivora]|uniref:Histidine phosphatase superfamily n=1 Tax=Plectosphaerella plurivora TaxID=936078 RepID=A0A9P9ADQ2_9PEZI|nr:histidine phosphatase superfamily [Plectosphaerella plurivora]